MSRSDTILPIYRILGVPVSAATPKSVMSMLRMWSKDPFGRYVCVRDVHGLMLARSDPHFMAVHEQAALVVPDGMPIAKLGKIRNYTVERTAGPDLMDQALADPEFSHFLYGGGEGIASTLRDKATERYPGVRIVGCETPPYRPLADREVRELAKRIDASGADLVWIGLSTPKQEQLMHRLAPHVGATLLGVGAAFDIHAGRMKRPPKWVQDHAMEGIYRLIKEPRRLWYRYCVLAPQFVALAAIEQLGGRWRA